MRDSQIRELQAAVSQVMGFALCDLMTACGSLIIAFYHSWKLALALLATLPISFLFLGIATRSLDLHVSLQKQFLQRASTSAAASIHGIDVVRVFAGFHREQNRYGHVLTLASRHFLAQARCNAIQIGYIAFWSISIFALGFWYGIVLVNQGVPPGHIITAFYALLTTFQGVESLAGYWLVLSKGKSAAFFLSYTESIVDEHAHGDLQSTELDICEGQETGIQLDKAGHGHVRLISRFNLTASFLGQLCLQNDTVRTCSTGYVYQFSRETVIVSCWPMRVWKKYCLWPYRRAAQTFAWRNHRTGPFFEANSCQPPVPVCHSDPPKQSRDT